MSYGKLSTTMYSANIEISAMILCKYEFKGIRTYTDGLPVGITDLTLYRFLDFFQVWQQAYSSNALILALTVIWPISTQLPVKCLGELNAVNSQMNFLLQKSECRSHL